MVSVMSRRPGRRAEIAATNGSVVVAAGVERVVTPGVYAASLLPKGLGVG
jgi:hypothetical protein